MKGVESGNLKATNKGETAAMEWMLGLISGFFADSDTGSPNCTMPLFKKVNGGNQ